MIWVKYLIFWKRELKKITKTLGILHNAIKYNNYNVFYSYTTFIRKIYELMKIIFLFIIQLSKLRSKTLFINTIRIKKLPFIKNNKTLIYEIKKKKVEDNFPQPLYTRNK